jgi:hypothetical protein
VAEGSESEALPPAAERERLVADLAQLTRGQGFSHLVRWPIVEPTPAFFPDRWAGGDASLVRLFRRLLHYAGLPELRVEVEIHEPDTRGGPPPAPPASGGVWLDGVEHGVARFMALAPALREPKNAVAAAARAVAHAFCEQRGLMPAGEEPRRAERRIDVASVYLGLGLLTTEAALRFYSVTDATLRSRGSSFRLGVLGPQAMAWLLAVQVVVRDGGKAERKQLARSLPPNQAAFFRAALRELDDRRAATLDALGIPPAEQWPPAPDLSVLTAPFEEEAEDAPETPRGEDRGVVGLNAGKPVFRVEGTMSGRLAKVALMATLMLGGMVVGSMKGLDVSTPHLWLVGIGLALFGLVAGRLFEDVRCSEPRCGAPLTRSMTTCPRCGGTVAGPIKHARERLAAEEALRRDP